MADVTAAEKYAQPEVVSCWQRLSRQGLQACEQAMVGRYLPPPPGLLLDAGCGAGRAALALSRAGYQVVGVDLSLRMLLAGRAVSPSAKLGNGDILALPFPDGTFDGVVMLFGALQHLPGRARRRRALAELGRVTRPGGRLVVGLDNLAPALVCYGYWLARKVMAPARRSTTAATGADAALWNRESRGAHPLLWHARGLVRSLRWRTWPGLLDLARRLRPGGAEPGDARVAQFSLQTTPGRTYYHLYRPAEFVADAAGAGWRLLHYACGAELNEGRVYPALARQGEKQLFFAFEKDGAA